jgi:two-component system, OmpR family, phosphate regulon sensor histidine kinase PhoR
MISSDQALAEILPDAVIVLNQGGEVLWHNTVAKNLFELTKTAAHLKQIIKDPSIKKAFHQRHASTVELLAPHRKEMVLALSILPYGEDNLVMIAKDVTHTHHLKNMRQDFVANVSHELRTPLTVVHGYLELLLEDNVLPLAAARKIFEQMMQQSLRMEQLVQDLLLLSRLETVQPEQQNRQKVNILALLTAICEDAQALSGSDAHNIQLKVSPHLDIYGQVDELRSAFSNIIFNAVHYTPAHGTIQIAWGKDKHGVYLKVQDTGIGIAAEHIPRLTERFYRVDKARSRASGGTGLGLAIVKHVLLRHDAFLSIQSQLGKGSSFTCHFPVSLIDDK